MPEAPDAHLDYWPILRQPAAVLMGQIAKGDHDAYLPQLRRMEQGHGGRAVVVEACDLRAAELATPAKAAEPAKPARK